ncbi:MAG: hypothetical protein H6613_12595 [Ignavibacteriales bacterium]|nr:hypothetical protein [Ignavibacteriales bacterium]
MAKDQAVRYQNASELLNDLEMFQVDPDYGFNTTPIKISALPDKKNKAKKVFFIGGLIFSLIIGSIILPFGWEKVKEIAGLNTVSMNNIY